MTTEYRHWRLYITNVTGSKEYITELQMRATVGGADQTFGKIATANSQYLSYTPSRGIDDSTSTYWRSGTLSLPGSPLWYAVDFGTPVAVKEITYRNHAYTSNGVLAFTLQCSEDGTEWLDVEDIENLTPWAAYETRVFEITNDPPEPIPPDYTRAWKQWRLLITGIHDTYLYTMNMELSNSMGGADLTEGKTATASTEYLDHVAAHAIDGPGTTYWRTAGEAPYPHWIAVDFGEITIIKSVVLQVNAYPDNGVSEFTLQCSDNGADWLDVQTFTGIPAWGASETRAFEVTELAPVFVPSEGSDGGRPFVYLFF